MKTIVFRGKNLNDPSEWVYGSALICESFTDIWSPDNVTGQVKRQEVIPETLGQYSGLRDSNETRIFDGDLICLWVNGKKFVNEVRFENGAFRVWQNETHCQPLTRQAISKYHIVVIGNVTDNRSKL